MVVTCAHIALAAELCVGGGLIMCGGGSVALA